MIFCVFSYNRGDFLKHCIETIERCAASAEIAVFDDNSDDENTRVVLADIAGRHRVYYTQESSTHKLGGLYGNIRAAVNAFPDAPALCLLQDDMQMVRPVSASELADIEACFSHNSRLAFIHPCFIKTTTNKKYRRALDYREHEGLYFRQGMGHGAGNFFSAVSILCPVRLRAAGWKFATSEPANDQRASQLFDNLAQLRNPFAMWLPEVPAYRGKIKTLALRLSERARGVGLYPFRVMSEEENQRFIGREAEVLPVAEDFLELVGEGPAKPWEYYPLQNKPWLKRLNGLELAARRLWARFS